MFLLKPYCKTYCSPILSNHRHALQNLTKTQTHFVPFNTSKPHKRKLSIRGCSSNGHEGEAGKQSSERKPFLTLEEAGLVEISGLSTHERFLCRLTVLLTSSTTLICLYKYFGNPSSTSMYRYITFGSGRLVFESGRQLQTYCT